MSTLNLIVFCIVGLLSSGCGDDGESSSAAWDRVSKERHDASLSRVMEKMPAGCTLTDLGVYETMKRDHMPLVLVQCEAKPVATANVLHRVNKQYRTEVVVSK